jgi:N-acetylglutamate synthase-like GNAT family acetyltransferase
MATVQTDPVFRKATVADVRHIQVLINSAFSGDSGRAGWTSEAAYLDDDRIDEAEVITKINQSNAFVLLAHDASDTLLGCCFIHGQGSGRGYMGLLAVDPSRQAGGLGKKILKEAEVMARGELGIRVIEGQVFWPREEMIDWYLRRGYSKTERTVPYLQPQLANGEAVSRDMYFIIVEKEI